MKKRVKRLKIVIFDMVLEIDEEEECYVKKMYVEKMEKEKRDVELKEVEKQIVVRVGRMVDGVGGFECKLIDFILCLCFELFFLVFDLEMDDWFFYFIYVFKFKWE